MHIIILLEKIPKLLIFKNKLKLKYKILEKLKSID